MSQFRTVSADQRLEWSEGVLQAMEEHNLSMADVASIVRNPTSIEMDPSNPARDWHTERRRRGDVIVVVTFPPGSRPRVWGVYVMSRMHAGTARHRKSAGSGAGTTAPTSVREIKRRLATAGFQVQPGTGGGPERILDPDGKFFWSLHTTPSEFRSLANVWSLLRRKALTRGIEL